MKFIIIRVYLASWEIKLLSPQNFFYYLPKRNFPEKVKEVS